jgi:hypothetical protein
MLPTASIVAVGAKPKEKADAQFIGPDITSSLLKDLDVYIHKFVVLFGPAGLTFEPNGGLWEENDHNFAGGHAGTLGIRIIKRTREAEIIYNFGEYEDGRYEGWPKYELKGLGKWSGERTPYETITVNDEEFTISQIFYESTSKKKGKGATSVEYIEVWRESLSFEITITPLP